MVGETMDVLFVIQKENLFLHEIMHGLVILPFVFLIWQKTKSVKFLLVPLIVTYLIDLDHIIDYILFFGVNFDPVKFFDGAQFEEGKSTLLFHAWEYLIPLSFLSVRFGWKSHWPGILFGATTHLFLDTLTQGNLALYSIIFRLSQNFYI